MKTTITWSAVIEDCTAPCVERRTSTIHAIATPPGDVAAATVMQWWLEDTPSHRGFGVTNWEDHAGDDETEVTALVMIHEPAELAGLYEVHAERKITARGYTAEPGEHQAVVKLLDAAKAATEVA